MTELLLYKEHYAAFSLKSFSEGKKSALSDDLILAGETSMTVIDGATAAVPFNLEGLTSGQFAAKNIANILGTVAPNIHSVQLADVLTTAFNQILLSSAAAPYIAETPEARPCASLVHATMYKDKLHITQIGDTAFRINGNQLFKNEKQIDKLHAAIRQKVMLDLLQIRPDIDTEELLIRGRQAIQPLIKLQRTLYQNKKCMRGYGVIDGNPIPPEFINYYTYPLSAIETVEIFTDGYFKVAEEPTIESWEQAFEQVEEEDPYKYLTYPSTKGSIPGQQYTDDRAIAIWRRS